MSSTKEAYKAKVDAQLAVWGARLELFKAKLEKASAEAKTELGKHIDELKVLEQAAKKHVAEVEASAADNWHKVSESLEQTWDALMGSLEAIYEKISPSHKSPIQ